MPSREEGFGLVACEALSLGVPILISSESGLADAIAEMAADASMSTTECIVSHSGSANDIGLKYAKAALKILLDQDAAANYTHNLREKLLPTCSWSEAARKLLEVVHLSSPNLVQFHEPSEPSESAVIRAMESSQEVLRNHAASLQQPGVIGASVRQVIVVFVEKGADPKIPKRIGAFDVVIREVDSIRFSSADIIRSGDPVLVDGTAAARVGIAVADTMGRIFFTTAAHAIPIAPASGQLQIVTSSGPLAAKLFLIERTADIALLEVETEVRPSGEVRALEPALGLEVKLALGNATALGLVTGVGAKAEIAGQPLDGLFEVRLTDGDLRPGDSGCLVRDGSSGLPMGSVVAIMQEQSSHGARTVLATRLTSAFALCRVRALPTPLQGNAYTEKQPREQLTLGVLLDTSETLGLLIRRLIDVKREQHGTGAYFTGTIGSEGPRLYAHALSTAGNLGAAVAATNLLRDIPIDYLFLVGIAGGLSRSGQRNGDVVVSSEIVYYEPAKMLEDRLVPRFRVVGVTPRWILSLAREISIGRNNQDGKEFVLRIGAIASGEKVIYRSDHLEQMLGGWGGVLAVEMEGAGVAEAASSSSRNVPLVVIRGIADIVGEKKKDVDRQVAAESAVTVAIGLTSRLSDFNKVGSPENLQRP